MNIEAGLKELNEMIAKEGEYCVVSYGDLRRIILLAMQSPCQEKTTICEHGYSRPIPDCQICSDIITIGKPSPTIEECNHDYKANEEGHPHCVKCGKYAYGPEKHSQTLADKFNDYGLRDWLKKNHGNFNSAQAWRNALVAYVVGIVDNAYHQGMKLSMGEAQRELIKQAKKEGFEVGKLDVKHFNKEDYRMAVEEGKRQAIEELKGKVKKYRSGLNVDTLFILHRELFGEEK